MIIAVINQKGGVGKTTTAISVGAGLAKGDGWTQKKVLLVDMDPQCNLSYVTRADYQNKKTILEAMKGEVPIRETIEHKEDFDVIPSSPYISAIDFILTGDGKEFRLKEALRPVRAEYDYIVNDSPPTLGSAVINVLSAADRVLIPTQADIMSLQGVGQLVRTIMHIREKGNPGLEILGLVVTRDQPRTRHSKVIRTMLEETAQALGTRVFSSAIREGVAIREACAARTTIFRYPTRSLQKWDYECLIEEIENLLASERGEEN